MNDTGNDLAAPPNEHTERRGILRIVIAELALALFIVMGVVAVARGASAPDANDAVRAGTSVTVSLATLPAATAEMYHYVADHADRFAMLPCFCGCDRSLGHRNLQDCFVNAAGGWDAHASGCGVCIDEALTAREQLDTNTAVDLVRHTIIDRYGPQPAA